MMGAKQLSGERDAAEIEPDLRGNTLRVYWYMLGQGSCVGVREVQRAMGMSSPSVASHHLSRLEEMDLVERHGDGSYELKRVVKVGILRNFVAFRGRLLPRYVFYATFFTVTSVVYLLLASLVPPSIFDRWMALAVCCASAIFGWFEAIRLWKLRFA